MLDLMAKAFEVTRINKTQRLERKKRPFSELISEIEEEEEDGCGDVVSGPEPELIIGSPPPSSTTSNPKGRPDTIPSGMLVKLFSFARDCQVADRG